MGNRSRVPPHTITEIQQRHRLRPAYVNPVRCLVDRAYMFSIGIGVGKHELQGRCCSQTPEIDADNPALAVFRKFILQPQSRESHTIRWCCAINQSMGIRWPDSKCEDTQ